MELSVNIDINAKAENVWDALVNPEKVRQYLFGTKVSSDFKVGSPITFEGEYDGMKYKDIGKIVEYEENSILKYSYHSSFSELEDREENYQLITYRVSLISDKLLSNDNMKVNLEISQENIPNEAAKVDSEKNWSLLLEKIKEISEE